MRNICFATGNEGKFREAQHILSGFELEQINIDLPELQGSVAEVALEKARIAFNKTKKPVFVDDTALACDALKGMPGVYIKHFLEAIGTKGIVKMVEAFGNMNAEALCAIGYCDGIREEVFVGTCKGLIVQPREGKHKSFGWDPLFQPEGYTDTFATLSPEGKNEISHRRRALAQFEEFLEKTIEMKS